MFIAAEKNVPVLEDLMEKSKCLPVIKSGKHFQIVMICANWALDCVLNSVQMLSQFIVTIAPTLQIRIKLPNDKLGGGRGYFRADLQH